MPKRGSEVPGTHYVYNNWDFDAAGVAFEINEACTELSLSCDWVLERLRMPSDNRAETRARLQRIDHALNIAQANVVTRTTDLGTARAGVDERVGAVELLTFINTLNEEISTQQQRFGEIASELKRDKQAEGEIVRPPFVSR